MPTFQLGTMMPHEQREESIPSLEAITDYRSPFTVHRSLRKRQRANEVQQVPDLAFAQRGFEGGHHLHAIDDAVGDYAIRKNRRRRDLAQVVGTPWQGCRCHTVAAPLGAMAHGAILCEELPSPGD